MFEVFEFQFQLFLPSSIEFLWRAVFEGDRTHPQWVLEMIEQTFGGLFVHHVGPIELTLAGARLSLAKVVGNKFCL